MKCLVIVDMQYGFNISEQIHIVRPILNRIKEFRKNGDLIVLVEFTGYGKTLRRITDELNKGEYIPVKKFRSNGGWDVQDRLYEELGESAVEMIDEFLLVGINLPYCVGKTASQLRNIFEVKVCIDCEASDDYSVGRMTGQGRRARIENSICIFKNNDNNESVEFVNRKAV